MCPIPMSTPDTDRVTSHGIVSRTIVGKNATAPVLRLKAAEELDRADDQPLLFDQPIPRLARLVHLEALEQAADTEAQEHEDDADGGTPEMAADEARGGPFPAR